MLEEPLDSIYCVAQTCEFRVSPPLAFLFSNERKGNEAGYLAGTRTREARGKAVCAISPSRRN